MSSLSPSPAARETSTNGSASGNVDEKPRLSEHEKKANHIASEQKRRQAIREGFDRLTELVPGLEGQGRSESIVLNRTVIYMREQLEERKRLVYQIEKLGGKVDDNMKSLPQGIARFILYDKFRGPYVPQVARYSHTRRIKPHV